VKPGHLVVVPNGMHTPVTLCPMHPRPNGEIWGAFVGNMYVHGIMDGEIKNLDLPQRIVNFV